MGEILGGWGHEVSTAAGPDEAVALAPSFRPHVAFINYTLPGMGGPGLARWFRSRPDLRQAMLIAASGYSCNQYHQTCRDAGFDFSVVKPIDLEAVWDLLVAAEALVRDPVD